MEPNGPVFKNREKGEIKTLPRINKGKGSFSETV
jgi:hypothetical protein